jgi:thiamine pyrophosphokinase
MKKEAVNSICIIGNGEKPDARIMAEALKDMGLVIAADGGSRICAEMGIVPDVIIGDMDSTADGISEIFPDTEIIKICEQDSSDMEKALHFAEGYKPAQINIIAALGGRTDHLIANILVFNQYRSENNTEICLYDNWGKLRYLNEGRHKFLNLKGRTVSFFSLGSISNLTLKGFRYNLENAEYKGYFGGLSNVYESEECVLEFEGDSLICYECYAAKGERDE